MPGILITFIIMKSLMNVDVVLKTEIPDIKKKMVQVKIESARNIQQVKMMPGNKQTLSRELKLDWETELYKDTVLCTSDTGQWMFLFWPLRGYGEPNDSFSFEFYRPVLDSVGHQIGDSTELWLKCKWIFTGYDTMNYNAERWLIEWYDMDWDPHYPYKQEVYYFSPYAYWIAAGIYPQVWVENVYGGTVKQPTEVTFYPGKWRGVIKTYYHTQDTFPEIPLDTNFVLVDDIVPEVRIVEIGDQGDTPAKDNITFLVAGEETVKVMVYENCYADVKLYISFQDSLPVKGSIDTINLGSIGKLLKEQMLKAAYYFGFMKGREFTLQLKVEDSWGNSFLSECEKADIGPVKVTVFNERDTVWPLYTGNGEGPYSTYIFVNAIRTWNGKAVRDLPLTFSLSRVVGSGGHHHGDSTELHGTLYYNGTVLQDADTLKTTEDGLILNYCSSVVGQQEVVRVRTREDYYVVHPPLDNESKYCDDTLYILVPGLVHYPDFAPECVAFKPQPEEHPDPFYIDSTKVNVMNAFFDTLRNFLDENYGDASEYPIIITDISLEYGGLYDINANWAPPHHTHREGKDIDIRCEWYYEDESKRLGLPVVWGITEEGKPCAKVPKLLEENVFKRWHVDAGIHNPTSKYAHYHLDIDYASFPQQQ